MIKLQEMLETIYKKVKNIKEGKNADYIPELKKVDPNLYAFSICFVNGDEYSIGDDQTEFAIESCSKIFTLAMALEKYGISALKAKIGNTKLTDKFNSVNAMENNKTHTLNSFYNGGAMATTSLLYEKNQQHFEKKIVDNMSRFAGRPLHVNQKIYLSEINNAEHNFALAHLLKSYQRFYGEVHKCVEVYTKQCSVMLTSKDVARMAATLANKGINPKTREKILDKKYISYILNHMEKHGLYEESDVWLEEVGFPMKSGVGGIILMVIPGVMGVGIISPPLNAHGNSAKGLNTARLLSKALLKK